MKLYIKQSDSTCFGSYTIDKVIDCPNKTKEEIQDAYYNKYQNHYNVQTEWFDTGPEYCEVEELNESCFDNSEEAKIRRSHENMY